MGCSIQEDSLAVLGALPAVGGLPRQGHARTISHTSERRSQSWDPQGRSQNQSVAHWERRAFQQTRPLALASPPRISPYRNWEVSGDGAGNRTKGLFPLPPGRALGKTGPLSPRGPSRNTPAALKGGAGDQLAAGTPPPKLAALAGGRRGPPVTVAELCRG